MTRPGLLVFALAATGCTLALDFGPGVLLPPPDAGHDGTASDVVTTDRDGDAGPEAGGDAGADAGHDAGHDAGGDAGPCGGHSSAIEPCCAGSGCNVGYVCTSAVCMRCGGNRELCCAGDACGSPRACVGGVCR
jgi:hypothetical protein